VVLFVLAEVLVLFLLAPALFLLAPALFLLAVLFVFAAVLFVLVAARFLLGVPCLLVLGPRLPSPRLPPLFGLPPEPVPLFFFGFLGLKGFGLCVSGTRWEDS